MFAEKSGPLKFNCRCKMECPLPSFVCMKVGLRGLPTTSLTIGADTVSDMTGSSWGYLHRRRVWTAGRIDVDQAATLGYIKRQPISRRLSRFTIRSRAGSSTATDGRLRSPLRAHPCPPPLIVPGRWPPTPMISTVRRPTDRRPAIRRRGADRPMLVGIGRGEPFEVPALPDGWRPTACCLSRRVQLKRGCQYDISMIGGYCATRCQNDIAPGL